MPIPIEIGDTGGGSPISIGISQVYLAHTAYYAQLIYCPINL